MWRLFEFYLNKILFSYLFSFVINPINIKTKNIMKQQITLKNKELTCSVLVKEFTAILEIKFIIGVSKTAIPEIYHLLIFVYKYK